MCLKLNTIIISRLGSTIKELTFNSCILEKNYILIGLDSGYSIKTFVNFVNPFVFQLETRNFFT